jgi:hypothetical protein
MAYKETITGPTDLNTPSSFEFIDACSGFGALEDRESTGNVGCGHEGA